MADYSYSNHPRLRGRDDSISYVLEGNTMTDSPIPQGAMDAAEAIHTSDDCADCAFRLSDQALARIIAAHTVDPAKLEHLRGCIRAMQDKKKKRSNRISNQRTCIKRQEKKLAERKAEIATIAKQRDELLVALKKIATDPDYTNPEGMVRLARTTIANTEKEPNNETRKQI